MKSREKTPTQVCIECDFSCSNLKDYGRHILTRKHLLRTGSGELPLHISKKSFVCDTCQYKCSSNSELVRHLSTAKHMNQDHIEPFNKSTDFTPPQKHTCVCGKEYAHRNSLWYHMKKCKNPLSNDINVLPTNHIIFHSAAPVTSENGPDNTVLFFQSLITAQAEAHAEQMSSLLGAQASAHAEQMSLLIKTQSQSHTQTMKHSDAQVAAHAEQTRLLVEAISLKGPQTIMNNTTMNNQFNLNVFLNEDCKNAYTLKEVVESIVCTVDDLDRMCKDGYAATVIRKILESMQDMSITERPIHCTDLHRNTVCIKDETGWVKGEAATIQLNNSVFFVGKRLNVAVGDWREAYPDHHKGTESRRKQYHGIVNEVLKSIDHKLEARIAGIVCRSIILDRKTATTI